MEPVFASVWGLLLFGERPGWLTVAGGAAVLGAVLLYTWAEREKTPAG
jgi:drug/metabolite transporter (DMT)-like permease